MTYDFIELAPQVAVAEWGWTIALFLWFIGLAGMGLFLNAWIRSKLIFYVATVSSVIGALFVLSHLHRIFNLPFAAINAILDGTLNFGSWMLIGICLLTVLCIVAMLQSYMLAKGDDRPLKNDLVVWINAALGLASTVYSGFLLTQAVGVTLWSTAALPVLWIFSGLACAIGLTEVLVAMHRLDHDKLTWLPKTANLVHIGEALVIFAFLQVALGGNPGAVVGAQAMLYGPTAMLFWGGAIGLGIVVPMFCGAVNARTVKIIGGLCAIVGALFLRGAVLFSGYFDPILF